MSHPDMSPALLQSAYALCQHQAVRLWRKQGRRYPLTEYLSMGRLAIAETWHTYPDPPDFQRYFGMRLQMRLRDVRRQEAGAGNLPDRNQGPARLRWETIPLDPGSLMAAVDHHSLPNRYSTSRTELIIFLNEILTQLEAYYGCEAMQRFLWLWEGYTEAEVATRTDTTAYMIGLLVDKIRYAARHRLRL